MHSLLGSVAQGLTVALSVALSGCRSEPTEIVVDVYTDPRPCPVTVVYVAGSGDLADLSASPLSSQCDAETGYQGRFTVVPSGAETADITAIEIGTGDKAGDPDAGLPENSCVNCIVARRIVRFVPERSVSVRVDLRKQCLNELCAAGTTCVAEPQGKGKACVNAALDSTLCDGPCDEQDLLRQPNCTAVESGVNCQCDSGYVFDRASPQCVALEGCSGCDIVTCKHMPGELPCGCAPGYELKDGTCVDIDECAIRVDDCTNTAQCVNQEGGFDCDCAPGDWGCSVVRHAHCGDGVLNYDEFCDDKNTNNDDDCSSDCRSDLKCGTGVIDYSKGEMCDDGNTAPGDGCSANCRSDETCGNGTTDKKVGEICDDGNNRNGDGCSADCLSDETCGNDIFDPAAGEACDDGKEPDAGTCSADCKVRYGAG